jgi:hypothetical protein
MCAGTDARRGLKAGRVSAGRDQSVAPISGARKGERVGAAETGGGSEVGVSAEQQLSSQQQARAEPTSLAPVTPARTNCVQRSNRLQTTASAVFMMRTMTIEPGPDSTNFAQCLSAFGVFEPNDYDPYGRHGHGHDGRPEPRAWLPSCPTSYRPAQSSS